MKRTGFDDHPCSIARTLDLVGEWWTPLILRDVAYGVRRFGELQEDLGISANVLADRLETLVGAQLLEQRAYQERPRRHEYRLTERGAELILALLALMQWGDRWAWPDDGGRRPVRVTHAACGHDVRVELRCPACEREVPPGELRARLGEPPPADGSGGGIGSGDPGYVSGVRLFGAGEAGVALGD